MTHHSMPARIAHYTIEHEIGRGGMGVVYLARDERLKRHVAIKALPPEMAQDHEGLARFEREALVLAALEHPHIAVIHGLERDPSGSLYLVLEWVRGTSLAERLRGGALGRRESFSLCRQVADALTVAHERGIVHRDLKPSNVMVTSEGRAKVLDFGLARRSGMADGATSLAEAAEPLDTSSSSSAAEGTASYMSPERILGSGGDRRADIFAFGCVLYECLTGRRAFHGATVFGALGQALRARPDWSPFEPQDPVRPLLEACLRKAPEDRIGSMREVASLLAQLERDAEASAREPEQDRSLRVPNNLPAARTSLVGREQEAQEAGRLLAASRMLTLTGLGGAGKTRLAIRLAEEVSASFADGVWFVDLSGLSPSQQIEARLGEILGLRESERPWRDVLIAFLEQRNALLVLDNAEDTLAATADFVAAVHRACAGVSMLVTSREPLPLPGTPVYEVPPLSYPRSDEPMNAAALRRHESVRLFVDRARLADTAFDLDDDNAPAVGRIANLLGGHPLAIELAAARARVLTPAEIARRLDDALSLLGSEDDALDRRQRTLRATLQWSYDHLSEGDRRALRALSVFPGDWDLATASALLEESEVAVLDRISRLAARAFLIAERHGEVSRYRLAEPTRQFAATAASREGEEKAIQDRFVEWALRFAEDAAPRLRGADAFVWLPRVEAQSRNLLAAIDQAGHDADGVRELRLVSALGWFWINTGRFRLARDLLGHALARPAETTPAIRAEALLSDARAAFMRGDYDHAERRFREAAEMAKAASELRCEAAALNGSGLVAMARNRPDAAERFYRQGLEIARRLGDTMAICGLLDNTAGLLWRKRDREGARLLHLESYERASAAGLWPTMLHGANGLGLLTMDEEDYEAARLWFSRALEAARRAGNRNHLIAALANVADVSSLSGDHATARVLLEEAMEIARSVDNRPQLAMGLASLAWVEMRANDRAAASRVAKECLGAVRASVHPRAVAYVLEVASDLALNRGEARLAAEFLGGAQHLRQGPIPPQGSADARHVEGLLARGRADLGPAFEAARESGARLSLDDLIDRAESWLSRFQMAL
ncbi:MAG TPA: protein kinase [Candidatus Eisenbacteria bacterium]|nr:protein kinase [Candidatus Eisenbacteria bacterium]